MNLTFLVDNNSLVGSYFLSEPGLSMLIEDGDIRILFDVGYSDAFLINARRMHIDLLHLDWLVLSHGHFDHTWGLDQLVRHRFEAMNQSFSVSKTSLLAHPAAFATKHGKRLPETGMLFTEDKLARHFEVQTSTAPVQLSDTLVALGEIEHTLDFEPPAPFGRRLDESGPVDDDLSDDTALAHITDDGLIVISGCAHSGICSTIEQARRVTGIDKIRSVIGGFHLLDAKQDRLDATTEYLADLDLESLYCCHCTDLAAKIALARKCPVKEVGSGLRLEF